MAAVVYGEGVSTEPITDVRWGERGGLLTSPLLDAMGPVAGFTTRARGSMGGSLASLEAQAEHRAQLAASLGFDAVARVRQVHGRTVVRADASLAATAAGWPEADALWTDRPGVLLGIVAADCVPVYLVEPEGMLGLAHAGWAGTSLRVTAALLEAMIEAGARPERMVAALGPSIGPCCYTIGEERTDLVRERLGTEAEVALPPGRMDLWAANRAQLLAAGVRRIEVSGICTQCGGADIWSYRARGVDGAYGTCMAYLGWPTRIGEAGGDEANRG